MVRESLASRDSVIFYLLRYVRERDERFLLRSFRSRVHWFNTDLSLFRREKIRFREEKRWGCTRREIFLPPLLLPSLSRLEGINYRVLTIPDCWALLSFLLPSSLPSYLTLKRSERRERCPWFFLFSSLSASPPPLSINQRAFKSHERRDLTRPFGKKERESVDRRRIRVSFSFLPNRQRVSHTHIITISFVSWFIIVERWRWREKRWCRFKKDVNGDAVT